MLRRLRATIRALIQLPSQLSTVRLLIEHLMLQQQETNDLLREGIIRTTGNLPVTPPSPALDRSTVPVALPLDSPPKLRSTRRRTDADVMVVDRSVLLAMQDERQLREAQADRDGQRIVAPTRSTQ